MRIEDILNAPTEQAPKEPATNAQAWAKVHAESLKPDRWYIVPGSEAKWRYVDGTAAVAAADGQAWVTASFEIPSPDGPPTGVTGIATPQQPFIETAADLTKTGNPKSSNQRKAEVTIAARVTPEEREAVKEQAAAAGLTVSQLIRHAVGLSVDMDD